METILRVGRYDVECKDCLYKRENETLRDLVEQLRQMLRDQHEQMAEKLSDDLQDNGFPLINERNGD
jgi:hypothetical protein